MYIQCYIVHVLACMYILYVKYNVYIYDKIYTCTLLPHRAHNTQCRRLRN